jgi:hypothetical protein
MSGKDFREFHRDLAEMLIAEVQDCHGELTSADLDRLERLALGAVVPEMLAGCLAVIAAEARDTMTAGAMALQESPS